MAKILFFFTNDFPFGKDETFIENEIPILAREFDKIILVSNDCTNKQTRTVPSNVIIERSSYDLTLINRLLSIFGIFSKAFWSEMVIIKHIYKKQRTSIIIKTALQSLRKSIVFEKRFSGFLSRYSSSNDSIYAYSYWADDTAVALVRLKEKHPHIKAFCRAHRWDLYLEQNSSGYLPFRKSIIDGLDAIFSISDDGKKYLENLFGQPFPNIKISRLGVLPHKSSAFDSSQFIIVTVSNIIAVKNLSLLVKALAKLQFDFKWYHIGDGPQRPEISLLAEHFIPSKYEFLGLKTNSEVITFLEQTPVSVFVNVSLSEGVPVSIMEAFSCGIPVLATDVGGNAEIVSSNNGMLVPADANEILIADALTMFKNVSADTMFELRQNAFKTWEENCNAEKNFQQFVQSIFKL